MGNVSSRENRICLLSAFDGEEFSKTGFLPSCRDHQHASRRTARKLADGNPPALLFLSDSVGAWNEARTWRKRPSDCASVMQLVACR
jgi:hypothetical protein